MKFAFSLILAFTIFHFKEAKAQSKNYDDCRLDVTIRIQSVLDSQAAENFRANRIQGFRILLYSGNDREEANRAKEEVYKLFPKGDVYMAYKAPTFKVRFGDFYTRHDAWQNLLWLRPHFSQAVILNEIVIVKP